VWRCPESNKLESDNFEFHFESEWDNKWITFHKVGSCTTDRSILLMVAYNHRTLFQANLIMFRRAQIFFFFFLTFNSVFGQQFIDSLVFVNSSGHASYVQYAAISPNKKMLLSASWDNDCILWDLVTGKQLLEFSGHSNGLIKAIFNPKRQQVISAAYDGNVFLWDANSGKLLDTLYRTVEIIQNIALNERGDKLVIITEKESAILNLDLPVEETKYIESSLPSLMSGNLLLIAYKNKLIRMQLDDSILSDTLIFNDDIKEVYLPNDQLICMAFIQDKALQIANLDKALVFRKLPIEKSLNVLSVSKNQQHISIINQTEEFKLYNLKDSTFWQPELKEKIPVWTSFLNDNSFLIYASDKERTDEVLIFDAYKSLIKRLDINVRGTPLSFLLDETLNFLIVTYTDYSTRIIDLNTSKIKELKGKMLLNYHYFEDKQADIIFSSYSDKDPLLSELSGSMQLNTSSLEFSFLPIHKGWIKHFQVEKSLGYMLTVSNDSVLKEIKLSSNIVLRDFKFPEVIKKAFYTSKPHQILIVFKQSIGVFDFQTRELILCFKSPNQIQDVTCNRQHIAVLFASEIFILDDTFNLLKVIAIPSKGFTTLKISANQKYILANSEDQIIVMKLQESNTEIHFIAADQSALGVHTFNLNGSEILLTQDQNHLQLLDLQTGKILNNIKVNGEIIGSEQFTSESFFIYLSFADSLEILEFKANEVLSKRFRSKYSYVYSSHLNLANNVFFASFSDKTCFAYNFQNGQSIMSYMLLENNNWLVKLSNSPFYMCSKDASKMLHYVTPSLKVIGFEQLDPVYNRPDIVLDSIGKYFGGANQELVANYRQSWEKRIDRLGLDKEKLGKGEIAVPSVEIVGADAIAYENKEGKLNIKVSANDQKYPLRRFNVYVNEVPLYGSVGISIAHLKKHVWDTTVNVPLSVGENKIQVSVMNELGLENFKYATYVNYTPAKNIVAKTYYIGIGVNKFKDAKHNLKYCVKDVTDLAKSFGGANTEVSLFTDKQVTKENILALKDYLKKTSVNDKVIISCSSHGLLDESLNFYLAMHDVDFNNPKARGLKYEDLESLLDGIPARQKLLLLDACNSGENDKTEALKQNLQLKEKSLDSTQLFAARGVIIELEEKNKRNFKKMNELFVNVRNNTGSVIISAAGGQESALEAISIDGKSIENGAFTYSILEYLKQNQGKDRRVNMLKQYAEKRVEEITNGKQKPTSRQETMEINWNIYE
jgi:WD40 repeat protein